MPLHLPCCLSLTTSGPELLFPDSPSMARVQPTLDSQQSLPTTPAPRSPLLPRASCQTDLTWGWAAVVLKLNCSPVLEGEERPPSRSLPEPGKEASPVVPWHCPRRPEHEVVHPADPELVGGVDW